MNEQFITNTEITHEDRLIALETLRAQETIKPKSIQLTATIPAHNNDLEEFLRKGTVTSVYDTPGHFTLPEDKNGKALFASIREKSPLISACGYEKIGGTRFTAILSIPSDTDNLHYDATPYEITARPLTNTILIPFGLIQDVTAGIENIVREEISLQMSSKIASWIVKGDGTNGVHGIIHNRLITPHNSALDIDNIRKLLEDLPSQYHTEAKWIMNRTAYRIILSALKKTHDWNMSVTQLYGKEIILNDHLPDDTPVIFGDFGLGYCLVESAEPNVTRDPYTKKPNIEITSTILVGGQVVRPEAIKMLKVSTAGAQS